MSMFGGMAAPSLADIAAVTRNNNDGDGWGGNGAWWVLIILFALFGGWGNNGYGNGNNGNCCQNAYDTQAVVQRGFDNQAVINKLNGIENGICSLGYDQLAQMNGINSTIMQTGFSLQQGLNTVDVNAMRNTFGLQQDLNSLSRQLSDCCCENRAAIAQVRYDMATDTCAIRNEVHQTGDAIIQNQNQGFQMLNNTIKDGFCSLEMREMQRENQALRDRLNTCDRNSALADQATYLLNNLNPQARPAYIVQNPNCCTPVPVQVQSSCGCGNNFNSGCCA